MRIAIITGASSGMGREFAEQISRDDGIDQLWLIARRRERLEELSGTLGKPVRILAYDLTKQESIEAIAEVMRQERPEVRCLVNSAGFGKFATYADLSLQESNDMISLNCMAAVNMTSLVIPYMAPGSRILEIVSSSAFQPLPGLNIYAATKAFMLSYTRALRFELRGKGIKVTAVCPGWVKTEFLNVAKATKNGQTVRFFPFAADPKVIVRRALRMNRLGVPVATCSFPTFVQRVFAKFVPHSIVMSIWCLVKKR